MKRILIISLGILFSLISIDSQAKLSGKEKKQILERHELNAGMNAKCRIQIDSGDYINALGTLDTILYSDPLYREAEDLRLEALAKLALDNRLQQILATGEKYYAKNDFQSALDLFNQVLRLKPNHPEAEKYQDLCKLAIRVKSGQSPTEVEPEKPQPQIHSYLILVQFLEINQVGIVLNQLKELKHIESAEYLDLYGDIAVFNLLGTGWLEPKAIVETLEAITEPGLQVSSPRNNCIVSRVITPRWMKENLNQ